MRHRGPAARRGEGVGRLRSAVAEPGRAGATLQRLGQTDGEKPRPIARRGRARRHDLVTTHDVDARRVRGNSWIEVARLHYRQAGWYGWIARSSRGTRVR